VCHFRAWSEVQILISLFSLLSSLSSAVLQPCPSVTGLASCPSFYGWAPNSREFNSSISVVQSSLSFPHQSAHRKRTPTIRGGPCPPFSRQLVTWYDQTYASLLTALTMIWPIGDLTNLIGCILTHQLPFQVIPTASPHCASQTHDSLDITRFIFLRR
jgi:hypothetical protein